MSRAIFITFFLTSALFSSSAWPNTASEKADALLDNFYRKTEVSGLAVSVMKNGKMLWSRGAGFADLEQNVSIDPATTKFRIASIAKIMTATAALQLVEEGKFSLSKDIRQYVPGFPKKHATITLHHLLTHQSGIRHYIFPEQFNNDESQSIKQGLNFFQNDPLLFTPGSKVQYSSYAFNLIGYMIESVSEKQFDGYMQKFIFSPAKMRNTVPDDKRAIISGRTRYYVNNDGQFYNEIDVNNFYKLPAGAYLSTTEDMLRFGNAMLENRLVSEETKTKMWTPSVLLNPDKNSEHQALSEFGLAWRIADLPNGERWVGHGGGMIGATANLWLIPEHNLVIAAASNMSNLDYGRLLLDISEVFK